MAQIFPDLMAAVMQRSERSGECLVWLRSCTGGKEAHPQLHWGDKVVNVRRELARLHGLDLSGRRVVRMTCRNGRCLEAAHMVAVDRGELAAQNSRDGVRDHAKASASARRRSREASSLSVEDVRTIFASPESCSALARRYGKSRALILRIKRRQVWADVLVTEAPRRRGRYEVDKVPAFFSALAIGNYLPSDTALSRAYGGER